MLHSRKMEHRISSIQKRVLKIFYQYSHNFTFQELLAKDKSVSFHQENLQLLTTEIFEGALAGQRQFLAT